MSDCLVQRGTNLSPIGSEPWVILSGPEQQIKQKIMSIGKPLGEWNVRISRGVLTGCNDAFIIDGETRDALIRKDPKSAEVIRPILRGRDIGRFGYVFADKWLIALFPSRNYAIEEFPAIKEWLEDGSWDTTIPSGSGRLRLEQTGERHFVHGTPFSARKHTGNKWFETQDQIQYWDDFSGRKIAYREISDALNACIVDEGVFTTNKAYILVGDHLEYILAVLNSRIFTRFILSEANTTGGKGQHFLLGKRIPTPSEAQEKEIIELVRDVYRRAALGEDTTCVEEEIDAAITALYGLTDVERALLG